MKQKNLILNPIFITALALLILNDLIFKWTFSSHFTGKLSDFTGLLIFPIFIAFLFPKTKKSICLIIGILFMFWKSSLASPFIDAFNSIVFFEINRTIDYSDYMAILVLPFSHVIINYGQFRKRNFKKERFPQSKGAILLISCFAFMATTISRTEMPEGTIYLGKSKTIKMSKDALLEKINSMGYEWHFIEDTLSNQDYYHKLKYYQIDNVVLTEGGVPFDTLKNIKFDLYEVNPNKTRIEIINIEMQKSGNIQDWRYLKKLNKFYKFKMRDGFLKEINK